MNALRSISLRLHLAAKMLAVLFVILTASFGDSAFAEGILRIANCRIVDDIGPVKAMGVNYVDGFWKYARDGNREDYRPTLDALAEAKVPFIRMGFAPWAQNSANLPADPAIANFVNNRILYFQRLDTFLNDAKYRHIGVVIDLFWNVDPFAAYFGESASAWSHPQSRTFAFLRSVVVQFAQGHGKDPEVWMVEFLNEGNLNIDFPKAPHTRSELAMLIDGLSATLRASGDIHIVDTGNSLPRPAAENLNRRAHWQPDSPDDFWHAIDGETPAGAAVASVHVYPDQNAKRPWDHGDILGVLPAFADHSRNSCRPVFIGEFGTQNLTPVETYIDRIGRSDVQLSAIWGLGRLGKDANGFGLGARGKELLNQIGKYNSRATVVR